MVLLQGYPELRKIGVGASKIFGKFFLNIEAFLEIFQRYFKTFLKFLGIFDNF
jgi:hypothetical protein